MRQTPSRSSTWSSPIANSGFQRQLGGCTPLPHGETPGNPACVVTRDGDLFVLQGTGLIYVNSPRNAICFLALDMEL